MTKAKTTTVLVRMRESLKKRIRRHMKSTDQEHFGAQNHVLVRAIERGLDAMEEDHRRSADGLVGVSK